MKYPSLIEKRFCNTPISGELEQEKYGNFGEPLEPIHFEGNCNYQERAKTIFTEEKKIVNVTGQAYFPGDICPRISTISGGEVTVFGAKRRIAMGMKARNPDGTVNYTVLELM